MFHLKHDGNVSQPTKQLTYGMRACDVARLVAGVVTNALDGNSSGEPQRERFFRFNWLQTMWNWLVD